MVKQYEKHLDYIILIYPSFEWNKTYQEWKYAKDPGFIAIECEQDQVDIILKHVVDVYKVRRNNKGQQKTRKIGIFKAL